ncbi:DUF4407 domain-containing protein [uncultured Litoreibacter sp.]|uniref:DUF4407 domain-containing protein n=1 Tax=uncultured Litoreibacter sp. TaxID=1392394 RepID=UPI0026196E38|nr:DUF4407 domain-containing protein [uncultured Litoreibacter sp.]
MRQPRPKPQGTGTAARRAKALRAARRRRLAAQDVDGQDLVSNAEKSTKSTPIEASEHDFRDSKGVTGEGRNRGDRQISRFARFVLPATGVDAERLVRDGSDGEFAKFVAMACLVIATTLFAFAGASFFFSELIPEHWGWTRYIPILFLATVWAYVIYNIDRMFLSSMLGRSGLDKLFAGSIRLALAIMLGIVISHPLKLLGIGQEIDIMIEIESLAQAEVAGERYEADEAVEFARLRELNAQREAIGAINDDGITEEQIIAGKEAGTLMFEVETIQAKFNEWELLNEESIALPFPYRPAPGFIRPTGNVAPRCSTQVELIRQWDTLIANIDLVESGTPPTNVIEQNSDRIKEFGIAAYFVVEDWGEALAEDAVPAENDPNTPLITETFGITPAVYRQQLASGEMIKNCSAGQLVERMWAYLEARRNNLQRIPPEKLNAINNIIDQTRDAEGKISLLRAQEEIRQRIAGALRDSSYPYRTVIFNQLADPTELDTPFRKQFITDNGYSSFFLFEKETRETIRSYNYAIILIFVFIESMPVLMKLLAGMGKYERSVHANENERTRMTDLAKLSEEKRKLRFEAAIDEIEKRQELRRQLAQGHAQPNKPPDTTTG